LTIKGLSGGRVKPSTLGFQIDDVELSPSPLGSSSPASRDIFEGSKALDQNEDLTILIECRRPAASGNSDSAKLARAIELATNQRLPCGAEAHHIVAVNAILANQSRGILAKHGIDINSVENGVPLPADSSVTQVEGMPHASLHTDVYHLEVRNRLTEKDASGGKQGVLQELEEIRQQLLNRAFPIL
ncbi:MAG: AHH domain-containing protein, partial [Thermostichus sp. BF3_bins_97]